MSLLRFVGVLSLRLGGSEFVALSLKLPRRGTDHPVGSSPLVRAGPETRQPAPRKLPPPHAARPAADHPPRAHRLALEVRELIVRKKSAAARQPRQHPRPDPSARRLREQAELARARRSPRPARTSRPGTPRRACCRGRARARAHLGDALDDPERDVLPCAAPRAAGLPSGFAGGFAPGPPSSPPPAPWPLIRVEIEGSSVEDRGKGLRHREPPAMSFSATESWRNENRCRSRGTSGGRCRGPGGARATCHCRSRRPGPPGRKQS